MVSTLAAQTAVEGVVKVVRMKGSARYTAGTSAWQPLKVGAVLKPGTVIQTSTDRGSFVDLVLGDGSLTTLQPAHYNPVTPGRPPFSQAYLAKAEQNTVRLTENTVLAVDKLTSINTGADVVTDTQLDLKAGRIIGNVKKMSAASKYEIKLPNGVAGIRGTFYDISADGVVRVVTGTVVIAYVGADGSVVTQSVSAGQQFDSRTGQISPIPQSVMQELQSLTPAGGAAVPSRGATKVNVSPEILFISPVEGQSGSFEEMPR